MEGRQSASLHPTEVHRELRGKRTGRELGQCEAFLVFLCGDPAAPLDQVLLHVPGERNRTAEAQRAEAQEIEDAGPQVRTLQDAPRSDWESRWLESVSHGNFPSNATMRTNRQEDV
jgi:hypothetical protein